MALAGAAALPAAAQTPGEQRRWDAAQQRFDAEVEAFRREREAFNQAVDRDRRGPGGGGGGYRPGYNQRPSGYDGPPPGYDPAFEQRYRTDYDAARYYRDGPGYSERVLGPNDQVYRGSDGRYYCRRGDGTTGLIVGGAVGGILGNVIDGGRNRVGGTLIGGALGALIGREADRNNVRCR